MNKPSRFRRARSFLRLITELKPVVRMLVTTGALVFLPAFAHAQKFVVAWSAVSALNSPFWVMNDAGFWKQEGLDIQLVYIASSPTVARATLAGEIVLSGANSQVIVDVGLGGGGSGCHGRHNECRSLLYYGGARS